MVRGRSGLALAFVGAAVLFWSAVPAPGAPGQLTVTFTPATSSATLNSTACVKLHVADGGGAPVANATPLVEFAKTPRGHPSEWSPPTTDANGDGTFCFTVPDVGEYDLYVNAVTTTAGFEPATSNTAVITGSLPPPNPDALVATPTVTPSPIVVGDDYTVHVNVRSTYGAAISGYELLVDFPVGTLVSATPARGSCTGALVCDFGTIAPGESIGVDVKLRAADAGAKTISLDWVDTTPAANLFVFTSGATATVTIAPRLADLGLSVLPSRLSAFRGHQVKASIRVVNNGPDSVDDAALTVTAPTTWLQVRTASGSGCAGVPLTCQLPALPSGASRTIPVIVTPRRVGRVALIAAATSASATDQPKANNVRAIVVTGKKPANH